MENKLISVIVPIYNTEKYLKRCIDSILQQTYKNLEIILIDDGSTDGSLEICNKYKNEDNRIRVIHTENGGVSRARNLGLENANGDFISFIDSDDYIDEDMYSKLYKEITNCDVDFLIFNAYCNYDFEHISGIITKEQAFYYILDKDKFRGYICNKFYKKSILKQQRFNEDIYICEDLLFNCEYLLKCKKCLVLNEKLYHYVERKNSAVHEVRYNPRRSTSLNAYEKLIDMYKKNSLSGIDKLYLSYIKEYSVIFYQLKKVGNKQELAKLKREFKQKLNIAKKYCNMKEKLTMDIYFCFPVFIQSIRKICYERKKNNERDYDNKKNIK